MRFSLPLRYSSVKLLNLFLCFKETLANPYPGRSAMYHSSFMIKWLINVVFPGHPDTFASSFLSKSMLINDDFPTFDLPIKAYSGKFAFGPFRQFVLLITNLEVLIFIMADCAYLFLSSHSFRILLNSLGCSIIGA